MFGSPFFQVYFALMMLYSCLFFPAVWFAMIFRLPKLRLKAIYVLQVTWSKGLLFIKRGSVVVHGIENIPEDNRICFVSNHQGVFDIPVMLSSVQRNVAFIAKKELARIPLLGTWMKFMNCVFIDRKDRRSAVNVINEGAQHIQNGHPMMIFPEGTRSGCSSMNEFKGGSVKLAVKSNALIVPVTINGTYKLVEQEKSFFTPVTINVTIHPHIDVSTLDDSEKKELPQKLYDIISSKL